MGHRNSFGLTQKIISGDSFWRETMEFDEMSDDLKEFLDMENLKKIHLIGHSLGGKISMKFSVNYKFLLKSLIVVDISPKKYDNEDLLNLINIMRTHVNLNETIDKIDKNLKSFIDNEDLRKFILTNLQRLPNGNLKWKLNLNIILKELNKLVDNVLNNDNEIFMGKTLFIIGAKSNYVDKNEFCDIKKIFPNSEFSIIENSGHWVHHDQPQSFIRVVAEFIRSTCC